MTNPTPAPTGTAGDLTSVLSAIQQNRLGLMQKKEQIKQQLVEIDIEESKFDSLIASLQVSITDPATLAAIEAQKELSAKLPLTPPAGSTAENPGGNATGAAQNSDPGAGSAPGVAGDASPAA